MRQKLAAGNWKMNGTSDSLSELDAMLQGPRGCNVLICPPFPLIARAADRVAGSGVLIGAQDCHWKSTGAHTGDVSAEMLRDAGASHVILGHSERRSDHNEANEHVRAKAEAVQAAELTAIVCIGESLGQREAGRTLDVVTEQLEGSLPDTIAEDRLVIAYEPIWAIGTGKVPTLEEIEAVHTGLRAYLINRYGAQKAGTIPLLYGGSVKPTNAAEIFAVPDVDGALVGGASLKADDFKPIIAALANS
jgi:triosephosphate isomerase